MTSIASFKTFIFSFLIFIISFNRLIGQCPGSTTSYLNPSVGLNNSSQGDEAWNNPNNCLTDNNSYATVSNAALLIGGTVRNSNYLVARNLKFNIPNNAIICGIQVEVRKFSSDNTGSNYTRDLDLRLLKGNQIVGTNHANVGINWPTTETAHTYGSNSDLWGTSLTGFDINSNGFGFAILIESRAAGLLLPTVISYVDQIRMRVSYYVPYWDIDNDGKDNLSDRDMDGDGIENTRELLTCSSPYDLTLNSNNDPTLQSFTVADLSMNVGIESTVGAGISIFNVSENYSAVVGPEIFVTQDVNTSSDHSIIRFIFKQSVSNLTFKLQDVDLGPGQFRDEITVNAYYTGQIININSSNYIIGSGNFNQFIGSNKFQGISAMNDNENNGTIKLIYPGIVDSIRIIYRNTDLASLGLQALGIGEFKFCNPESASFDSDGDGKPDYRDKDKDNDGILDLIEYQSSIGFIYPSGVDSNGDGLDNSFDPSTGGTLIIPVDTDMDFIIDSWDQDSDNDGITDQIEGNDANRNCIADFNILNIDTNGDGLDNNYDPNNGGTFAPIQDSDGNGIPDFRQSNYPTPANAGQDKTVSSPSTQLAANTPVNGRGEWTVQSGQGTFADIYDPNTLVSNLQMGNNTFVWTIRTDACKTDFDAVVIERVTIPVPVEMGPFIATRSAEHVKLEWVTFAENNNKGFRINRSSDGINWKNIGWVEKKSISGNSTIELNYQFVDKNPIGGINYYKLDQTDINGKINSSEIRSVKFNDKFDVIISPNPAINSLKIEHINGEISDISIYDVSGLKVYQSSGKSNTQIDVKNFQSGIYLVLISGTNGEIISKKFVKL